MRNKTWTLPAVSLSLLVVCVMGSGLWGQSPPPLQEEVRGPVLSPLPLGVRGGEDSSTPIPPSANPQPTATPSNPDSYRPPVTLSPELEPYLERVETVEDEPIVPITLPPLPTGFEPWWMPQIAKRLRPKSRPVPVTVEWLTWRALDHSPQVLAMNLDPTIRETQILVEQAEFDWQAFVDSAFNSNSNPVGNTLTTGGSPRFRDRIWGHTMGFRRRTGSGGEFEASQRIGYQNNNSIFFVPTQQGTSLLTLSFTQPLLARSGKVYNTSRIAIAHLETGMAEDELLKGLQDHLVQVTEAYWELYRARAILQQKQKLLARAEYVLEMLEARKDVDAQLRQILRARAAVASRRSEITRAAMSIRNAESKLRLLVNDPELIQGGATELLPHEPPLAIPLDISMGDSLVTAIQNRPEIAQALKGVRNKSLQVGMAESEFKPALDFVMGTYVSGLQGGSDIPQSFLNQFNQGEPGWSAGFLFDMPLGRRAARAKLNRVQMEMQQALFEFRTSVERTLTEVEMSVREVRTTYQEMLSTYQAMLATETEARFLYDRWRVLVGGERSTTLLLEDLLDAQERVAEEEANFVNAQVGYVLALANLKRTMGVLLMTEDPAASPPPEPIPVPPPRAPKPPAPEPIEAPALPFPEPAGPGYSQSFTVQPTSRGYAKPDAGRISNFQR